MRAQEVSRKTAAITGAKALAPRSFRSRGQHKALKIRHSIEATSKHIRQKLVVWRKTGWRPHPPPSRTALLGRRPRDAARRRESAAIPGTAVHDTPIRAGANRPVGTAQNVFEAAWRQTAELLLVQVQRQSDLLQIEGAAYARRSLAGRLHRQHCQAEGLAYELELRDRVRELGEGVDLFPDGFLIEADGSVAGIADGGHRQVLLVAERSGHRYRQHSMNVIGGCSVNSAQYASPYVAAPSGINRGPCQCTSRKPASANTASCTATLS